MNVQQLSPGLWRWTAPHPDWTLDEGGPDGWDQMVGCVYYEAPDAVVLIDPLAPPAGSDDHDRFWRALDRDVRRAGLPLAVLLTCCWHDRSAQAVYDRYRGAGATIWVHEADVGRTDCIVSHAFRHGDVLPGGVRAFSIAGAGTQDTNFYLPPERALVSGDSILGVDGSRLRVCPVSWWRTDELRRFYRARFLPALRDLLEVPLEAVLTSHGEPVLANGRAALAQAIEQASVTARQSPAAV